MRICALIGIRKPTLGGLEDSVMDNQDVILKALMAAQHELTTLHNLTVTDNIESKVTWTTNTNEILELVNLAIIKLEHSDNQVS